MHLIQPLECRVPFAVAEVEYYAYGADVGSGSVVDANPTTENKVLGPGAASGLRLGLGGSVTTEASDPHPDLQPLDLSSAGRHRQGDCW